MFFAYHLHLGGLTLSPPSNDPGEAIWIDLYRPLEAQVEKVEALGISVPTREAMNEIELSSRLYRIGDANYMTAVLPGLSVDKEPVSRPVSFILTPERLITVRHHAPAAFSTFAGRADRAAPGCHTPERLFLSLLEENIGHLADELEEAGDGLDTLSSGVFAGNAVKRPELLQRSLEVAGRIGDRIGQVRLSLLTLERALQHFGQDLYAHAEGGALRNVMKSVVRDVQALAVHSDFLSSRVSLATDATLGMINLAQNQTVRIISVVAALFVPPTLIASVYGMNFERMPELDNPLGYPVAILAMVASAVVTFVIFKWRRWL